MNLWSYILSVHLSLWVAMTIPNCFRKPLEQGSRVQHLLERLPNEGWLEGSSWAMWHHVAETTSHQRQWPWVIQLATADMQPWKSKAALPGALWLHNPCRPWRKLWCERLSCQVVDWVLIPPLQVGIMSSKNPLAASPCGDTQMVILHLISYCPSPVS